MNGKHWAVVAAVIAASLKLISAPLELLPERSTDGDLEWNGPWPDGRTNGFIPRAQLLKLATVTVTNRQDLALHRPVVYTGIPMDELLKAINPSLSPEVVWAICRDRYAAYYTTDYRHAKRPILVLLLDGKDYPEWPISASGVRMSPFYVSFENFAPDSANTFAGQPENPRIPYGVVALKTAQYEETVGRLTLNDASSTAREGQALALRECLYCHFDGRTGGRLSGKPWLVLAAWAEAEPALFRTYIRNPRQVEPTSRMPGFPDFSAEAAEDLQQYFSAFLKQQVRR